MLNKLWPGFIIISFIYAVFKFNMNELNKLTLEEKFEYYKKIGLDKKDIIKKIAKDRNVPKNEIYQHFIN